jgi:hypothetical protein
VEVLVSHFVPLTLAKALADLHNERGFPWRTVVAEEPLFLVAFLLHGKCISKLGYVSL